MKTLYFSLLIIILSIRVYGQSNDSFNLEIAIENYNKQPNQEILYLSTNNDYYLSGDELIYNITVVDSKSFKSQDVSSLAYVELINSNNQTVELKKVLLRNGRTNSFFKINDTLSSGEYILKAYTNWMRNFSIKKYERKIHIINSKKQRRNITSIQNQTESEVSIELFPEGGVLIPNVQSKVGVYVHGIYDNSDDLVGVLKDADNNIIEKININKYGIGAFNFKPEYGTDLELFVEFKDAISSATLMQPKPENATLAIENDDKYNQLFVKGFCDTDFVEKNGEKVFVYIQARGEIYMNRVLYFRNNNFAIDINKNRLVAGINEVVLTNEEGSIISKRLVYIDKGEELVCQVKNLSKQYKTNDSLTLGYFTLKDYQAEKSISSISVKANKGTNSKKTNLKSYLLLENGIQQKIEDPYYYFENNEELENLMLVCSSRFLPLSNESEQNELAYNKESKGFVITGLLYDAESLETIKDEVLLLNIPGKTAYMSYDITDSLGNFSFNIGENLSEDIDVVIQPLSGNSTYRIKLDTQDELKNGKIKVRKRELTDDEISTINSIYVNNQINSVYSNTSIETGIEFGDAGINNNQIGFYGRPHQSIDVTRYIDLPNLQELFRELVKGVKIKEKKGEYSFKIFNGASGRWMKDNPAIHVDGVLVTDNNKIMKLDPKQIEKIDVVNWVFVNGRLKYNGLLNIVTKKGNCTDISLPMSTMRRIIEGPEHSATNLVYRASKKNISHHAFFGKTLYWESDVEIDTSDESFSFYTNDETGLYMIEIEGISEDGTPFYHKETFEVKK